MAEPRRLTQLCAAALDRIPFPADDVTVALSGGADSSALAYLGTRGGLRVDALHVNHGFPGSPSMQEAAEEVARLLEIPIEVVHVEVEQGSSPEAMARDARYRVVDAWSKPVLTGHTIEDSVETFLLNLLRGTGAAGLSGIPRFRPPITYRPLLEISRSETREIATLVGLPFVDDPMNSDMSLGRNRVRRRVLPLLSEINPSAVANIARAARNVEADHAFVEQLADQIEVSSAVPAALIEVLPSPVADRLLARLLTGSGVGATADRVERLREVASGAAPRHDIAQGKVAVRRGAMLVVE